MDQTVHSNPSSSRKFTRRAFFSFLIAGLIVLALRAFRGIDHVAVVQEYFGFNEDHRSLIQRRFNHLRIKNPVLYRDSILYFGLSRFHLQNALHKKLRSRVTSNWIVFLFHDRKISWPYVGYPSVGDYQICNGLIRKV